MVPPVALAPGNSALLQAAQTWQEANTTVEILAHGFRLVWVNGDPPGGALAGLDFELGTRSARAGATCRCHMPREHMCANLSEIVQSLRKRGIEALFIEFAASTSPTSPARTLSEGAEKQR